MALEVVVGAVVGAVVGELLKAVIDTKNKVSNFRLILASIEGTLNTVIPRLNEISCLNNQLNLQQKEMEELIGLLKNGMVLVLECSTVWRINFFKKRQYSKKLLDLDNTLRRHFETILPLEVIRDAKEILVIVREVQMKLAGDNDESTKPGKDLGSGSHEAGKLHQDAMKDEHMELYRDSDEEKDVSVSQYFYFKKVEKHNKSSNRGNSSQQYKEIKQSGKKCESDEGKLFLLQDRDYHLDPEDLLRWEYEVLFHGTNGTSYRYNKIQNKPLIIKRLKKFNVEELDFAKHIEFSEKIGQQHPNIMFPSGYYFSEKEKLLIYDSEVLSDNLFQRLHEVNSRQRNPLEWKDRVKIALGTARGIYHLHSIKFFHGNIESSNVLITLEYDGIISDYGLNSMMNLSAATSKTSKYCAPEFVSTGKATEKSDVYSFGIMLHEIIREGWNCDIYDFELGGSYEKEKKRMLNIAVLCVESEPNKRPNMEDVVRRIEKIQTMSPGPNYYECFDP